MLEIEEGRASEGILCECCGNVSRSVTGFVYDGAGAIAAYFVHWTQNALNHDPNFDFIVGRWGDGASPEERYGVSLQYRLGVGFTIIDASSRPFAAARTLFSTPLPRAEVIGTGLAPEVFSLVDAVWLQDSRLEEMRAEANKALNLTPRGGAN